MDTNWNTVSSIQTHNFFYCKGGHSLEQVAQRDYGVSIPGDIENSTGHLL